MRRVVLSLVVAAIAASALASGALAKEPGVDLSTTPYNVRTGVAWMGTLVVFAPERQMLREARPYIEIRNIATSQSKRFDAKPTSDHLDPGDARQFSFSVVFPTPGRYRYEASDGLGTVHTYPAVEIVPDPLAASGSEANPGGEEGLSHWPLVGALGGLGLAALVVPAYRRRGGRR